ncbi:DUF6221 family protein [Streptomyces sp. NPDC013489]|uniref:DUF6221 family protein n=1 Tax=Streptomyces sp. NPDC013489 TaxID=3155606 RepID=UPI0033C6B446
MEELIAFLRARLNEDEQTARHATDGPWVDEPGHPIRGGYELRFVIAQQAQRWNSQHIARHDPARVLAEVDAKRRIIDECAYWLDKINESATAEHPYPNLPERGEVVLPVITLLGLPYADHPDYQDAWRP